MKTASLRQPSLPAPLATHHGVDVEWRPGGGVVGAEPGEGPPLRGSTGCVSSGAAFPSPPLASLLSGVRRRRVRGRVGVLRAGGVMVMVVVSVVTVVSLLVASVMVEAGSSGQAASAA